MSDPQKPPPRVATQGSAPPKASNPNLRVMSAARTAPPPAEQGPLSARLKSGAENTALNVVGILRDTWADFRSSDRFFKYKALILGSWIALTVLTFAVSCPGGDLDAKNRLGARLVTAGEPSRPIYMIVNDSEKSWTDVLVVVNAQYRAAVADVEAHGNLTLTPKQLIGPNGKLAPTDLRITDLELRTGNGKTKLLKEGQPQ